MSVKASSTVWADQSITDQGELLVLLAIADYANDEFVAWPSIESIALKARLQWRSVYRILGRLKARGKLRIDSGQSRHQNNRYTIILNPVSVSVSNPDPKSVPPDPKSGDTLTLSTNYPDFDCPPKSDDPSSTIIDPSEERKVVAPLPLASVLEAWNQRAGNGIPKCLLLSDKRRRSLQSRLRDNFFVANWQPALDRLHASAFCRGENNRGWRASFDWFLQPDTVAKLIEGKYDNTEPNSNPSPDIPVWARIKSIEALIAQNTKQRRAIQLPSPLQYENPNGPRYLKDFEEARSKREKLKAEGEELQKKLSDLQRQSAYGK